MADPEVDLFAGMKKKKKKQVALDVDEQPSLDTAPAEPSPADPIADVSPKVGGGVESGDGTPIAGSSGAATPVEATTPAVDGGDLFADLKKKKKKKKEIPLDLDAAATAAPDGLDVPMKKKKSRKPAEDFAKELDELDAENDDGADGLDDGDINGDGLQTNGDAEGQEPWVLEGRDPTYPELLRRFFSLLHAHNPELAGEKRKYTIVPPQIAREGTKKIVFSNVFDICRRMHRQPEHVLQFLFSELGTQGSIDGAQRLVMKGRFSQKQIENVLRKYIVEYVTCKICKSSDTLLGKENRLYFITCETCGSRRSVSAIKAGYQAQIGKRVKAA